MFSHPLFKIDYTAVAFTLLFMSIMALVPDPVSASSAKLGDTSGLGGTICNVVRELQGPVARGLAAIAIIFLGFSLFLGKISWGIALALAIGIGAVFGAPQIVSALSDTEQTCGQ
jgi:type IV secretory pathway VirB2 component (pilin)